MSSISVFVFSSATCEPCKHIKPVWAELKEDYDQYNWHHIDINNDSQGYSKYFHIESIPSMVVVKDETIFGRHKGTQAMGYLSLLKRAN